MKKLNINIEISEYDNISELLLEDINLIETAKDASERSYSPYSEFSVGAAVLLENGIVVDGNNQENAAYPSGLCAERVALFYANSKYPEISVKTIAIVVKQNNKFKKTPLPPCGSCRQALMETEMRFKTPIKVIMAGEDKVQIIHSISDLLPLSFTSDFLKTD